MKDIAMKISEKAGTAAYFVEKYLFSLYFAVMASRGLYTIYKNGWWHSVIGWWGRDWTRVWVAGYSLSSEMLLVIFNVMVGVFLIRAGKPQRGPENLKELAIPFAATFFYVAYSGLPAIFPAFALDNPIPASARWQVMILAMFLVLGGLFLNIFSLYHLRKSFAVFVQVKEIVFSGPYAYIRHPMYTSHLLMAAGLVLSRFSPAIFTVFLIHAGLLAYRARLEEAALAAHDPKYAEHMKKTGFLIPI